MPTSSDGMTGPGCIAHQVPSRGQRTKIRRIDPQQSWEAVRYPAPKFSGRLAAHGKAAVLGVREIRDRIIRPTSINDKAR